MRRRGVILTLVSAIALVVAVAVLSAAKHLTTAPAVARVNAAPPVTGHGEVGSSVGHFASSNIDGGRVAVPTNGKPGILWFFAGWCGECLPEGRSLGKLQSQFGSRASITGISPDPTDSLAALRSFRRNIGEPGFPFIWSSDGALGQAYRVSALDTTLVYDARGKIAYRGVLPDLATLRRALATVGVS